MRWLGEFWRRAGEDGTAKNLAAMLGRCPACASDFHGHYYALFAVAIARKKDVPTLTEFVNHAEVHNWKALREFKKFDGSSNNLLAFMIRCFSGGALVLVRSPFELFENDEVLMIDPIEDGAFAEVVALVPATEWHPFEERR